MNRRARRMWWALGWLGLLGVSALPAHAVIGDLRAATAVTVMLGPFVDDTDGKTPETALTLVQADVKLSKNGGALGQKNDATGCSHLGSGYYACPLNTTDTNTTGILAVTVNASGALPVRHEFPVLVATAYDALYSTGAIKADVDKWSGTTVGAPDTAGYPKVTIKDGTGTGEIDTLAGGVSLKTGAIGDGQYDLTMTISAEAANSITDADGSPDPITTDGQWADGFEIQVFDGTSRAPKTSTCITNSTAATNVFTTRDDRSAITAVGDFYQVRPAAACLSLRPTTAGRTLTVSAGGAGDAQVTGMAAGVLNAAAVATGANAPVMIAASTTCDISAATSATSWTIATCQSAAGESITLSNTMFAGRLVTAYTNGASACNVVGQAAYIDTQVAGVVNAKTVIGSTATPVFAGTPNTSNCGIRIY